MENYKNKRRKGLGGFPTRCVGCLLALIVLFNSFSAYALNYSNDSYPIDISNVPPMTELYTLSKQLSHNIWFGYSPTNQLYYYISWEDIVPVPSASLEQTNFIFNNDSASSQFNTLTFWAHWNNTPMGNTNGFYYVYDVNGIQWQEMTISVFEDIYGQQSRNISLPSDFVLLACEMNTPIYDSNDNLRFRYRGNFNRSYMNGVSSWNSMQYYTFDNVTTKYYFNSTGTIISNGEPGSPDGEITNSGIKGWFEKLKLWLENLGSSISNSIASIQGWLSSLGSTIGGFFSDLWINHLSGAFSNVVNWIKAPFQEGGIIYNLWNGLKDFFIDVGDWFLEIPDNIKALFIPSDSFWVSYNEDFNDLLDRHFGGILQAETIITDLIGLPPQTRGGSVPSYYYKYSCKKNVDLSRFKNTAVKSRSDDEAPSLLDILNFEEVDSYIITIPRWYIRMPGGSLGTASGLVRRYLLPSDFPKDFDLADLFYFNGFLYYDGYDWFYIFKVFVNASVFLLAFYRVKAYLDVIIFNKAEGDL